MELVGQTLKLVSVPESPPLGLYDTEAVSASSTLQAATCEMLRIDNVQLHGGSTCVTGVVTSKYSTR